MNYDQLTDEQMLNLLKIGLETDLEAAFDHWRRITCDYEPEQDYGSHHDFRRHIQYGGTVDDY